MFMSRLKQFFGQKPYTAIDVSKATTESDGSYALTIPDGASTIVLTGAGNISHLYTASRRGDRAGRVIFLYSNTDSLVFVATVPATAAGDIESGNLNINLNATCCIFLYLRSDGVWVRMTNIASN